MIKFILIILLLASCSTTKDCPKRKKGIACHQKVVESIPKNRSTKFKAAKGFKECCEKYKYENSCIELDAYEVSRSKK